MHLTAAKGYARASGASGRSSNGMVDGAGEEVRILDRHNNEDESRVAWVVSALVDAGKMSRLNMENKSNHNNGKFWHVFKSWIAEEIASLCISYYADYSCKEKLPEFIRRITA
jgi:hypothetical protein